MTRKFTATASAVLVAILAVLSFLPVARGEDGLVKILCGSDRAKLEQSGSDSPLAKLAGADPKSYATRLDKLESALELGRDAGRKYVSRDKEFGAPALAYALYAGGDPLVVDALLAAGADPNGRLFGAPILWHAIALGGASSCEDALNLLDYGADPNGALPGGETVLMRAAVAGDAHVVRRLLEYGADPKKTVGGKTAKDLAKDKDVRDLLSEWGRKYKPRDPGMTPLARAASQNNYWAVRRRLEAGDDQTKRVRGLTPAEYTTDDGVRALFKSSGGKKDPKLVFSKKRVKHAIEGEYDSQGRHDAGGHSNAARLHMDVAGLGPKTYALFENGVQVCSVDRHTPTRVADDPAKPRHTFFPAGWSRGDIIAAVNEIARAGLDEAIDSDSVRLDEEMNGVLMSVVLRADNYGNINVVTAYPVNFRQPKQTSAGAETLDAAKRGAYRGGRR